MQKLNGNSEVDYLSMVQAIVARLFALDADHIRPTTHFYNDIGMDSLDMVELLMDLEQALDIEIKDEDLDGLITVGGVCAYLEKHKIPVTVLDEGVLDLVVGHFEPDTPIDYEDGLVLTRYGIIIAA